MKYIRTKDGRIIYCIKLIKQAKKQVLQNEEDLGWKRRVIKQADTIEELCDEKIGTFKDGSKPYIYKQTSWGDLAKDWTQYHNNVYGAIWTDKGLIYVAKMNEKGELELI